MSEFLLHALLAGVGIALVCGPLGTFVVWRRMSYFGDTLAHSALLGIALGFMLELNLNVAVVVVCLAIAVILVTLEHNQAIATDTLLGILAHGSLSAGLVLVALLEVRIDLMGLLFGDLLAVSEADLYWILVGGPIILLLLWRLWKPLLSITLHEELAEVEGIAVRTVKVSLMLMIALVIAIAMKIVGILLITSLLIIPAATARYLAKTPEQMAIIASLIGCLAVVGGLSGSYQFDTPTGPSIVLAATLLFILIFAGTYRGHGYQR